jgi:TRAP-type mannitol/chloroaromatic compound transport system substrate-binding protein
MKRRDFVTWGAAAPLIVPAQAVRAQTGGSVTWRLASSFPPALDTVYAGATKFAEQVHRLSDGRFKIEVLPIGNPVAPLGVFDAVSKGEVDIGHSAGYYYVNKSKALAFDTALPFGLNARQQNAWVYEGGGMELLRAMFAKYNIVNFPAGNTGTQMGGWFNREINKAEDFRGLKMRIPGLAGQIMKSLGVEPVSLPGSEIVAAMKDKRIDAAEWVGPYDDEKLGLHNVAKYYYYPAWWEPSTQISMYVNKAKFDALPGSFKSIVENACSTVNAWMMAAYDSRNPAAYRRLVSNGQYVRLFPGAHMIAAQSRSFALFKEEAAKDVEFKKLFDSWNPFRSDITEWHGSAEAAILNFAASRLMR